MTPLSLCTATELCREHLIDVSSCLVRGSLLRKWRRKKKALPGVAGSLPDVLTLNAGYSTPTCGELRRDAKPASQTALSLVAQPMIFRYLPPVAVTVVLLSVLPSHLCRSSYAGYAEAAFTATGSPHRKLGRLHAGYRYCRPGRIRLLPAIFPALTAIKISAIQGLIYLSPMPPPTDSSRPNSGQLRD